MLKNFIETGLTESSNVEEIRKRESEVKIIIKALGQTVEHDGGVVLVVEELPDNCMVLFLSKEAWEEIKDDVELAESK